MTKTEQARLRAAIRRGEMDETWVTLANGDTFFSNRTIVTSLGAEKDVTFYTPEGPRSATVADIQKAVH